MVRLAVLLCAAVCTDASVFRTQSSLARVTSTTRAGPHGNANCPCVGMDDVKGWTEVSLRNGKTQKTQADIGAHCNQWEEDWHPDCKGQSPPAWCKQKWCYVDPCNCNVADVPKPSYYLPDAKHQDKPLHYSYATCGGPMPEGDAPVPPWKAKNQMEALKNDLSPRSPCSKAANSATWGSATCRCIGIGNPLIPRQGEIQGEVQGTMHPADYGAFCHHWDGDKRNAKDTYVHAKCTGDKPPAWCSKPWCYVDPCACKEMNQPPKPSLVFHHANLDGGRPVYYSFSTCGQDAHDDEDAYHNDVENPHEPHHPKACVFHKSKDACEKQHNDHGTKCAWNGKECLWKEMAEVCP